MEIDWIAEGFGKEPQFMDTPSGRYEDTDENRDIIGLPSRQEEAASRAKAHLNTISMTPPNCIGGTALMLEKDARLTMLVLQSYMSGNDPFDVSIKRVKHRPKTENNIGLIFKMYLGAGLSQEKLAEKIRDALEVEEGRKATFDRKTVANRIKEHSWWDSLNWDVETKKKQQKIAEEMLDTVIRDRRLRAMLKGK